MIKDSPEVLSLAEKIINSLDIPDPEVMLEMEVLEVKRSKLQDLGVKVPTSIDVPFSYWRHHLQPAQQYTSRA